MPGRTTADVHPSARNLYCSFVSGTTDGLTNPTIVKTIIVPGKMVNFVVK